jgi:hypothetical protein
MIRPHLARASELGDVRRVAERLGARLMRSSRHEYVGPCPACGGNDRFGVNVIKNIWNCRQCAKGGDVIELVRHVLRCSFIEAREFVAGDRLAQPKPAQRAPVDKDDAERPEINLAIASQIVRELKPTAGTRGEAYLAEARRINTAMIADVLGRTDAIGWHPAVYFSEPKYRQRGDPPHPLHGRRVGAIIGIMTDPATARPTGGISRTFIHEGRKVGKAKSLGPAGIVRLNRDEAVLGGLSSRKGSKQRSTRWPGASSLFGLPGLSRSWPNFRCSAGSKV